MQTRPEPQARHPRVRIPFWAAVCVLVVIALFFLVEEHRAHLFGALPYLLLLLCPVVHLLVHRGHGGHDPGAERHGHRRDGGSW